MHSRRVLSVLLPVLTAAFGLLSPVAAQQQGQAPAPQQAAPAAQQAADPNLDDKKLEMIERMLAHEATLNAKLAQLISAQRADADAKLDTLELRCRALFLSIFSLDESNFFLLTHTCNEISKLHTECSSGNFPFYLSRMRMEVAVQRYGYLNQSLLAMQRFAEKLSETDKKRLQDAVDTSGKLFADYRNMLDEFDTEQKRFERLTHIIGSMNHYANGMQVEINDIINSDNNISSIREQIQQVRSKAAENVRAEAAAPKAESQVQPTAAQKQGTAQVSDQKVDETISEEKQGEMLPDGVVSEVTKAYDMDADLGKLNLGDEIKREGRLAARIVTELWDPSNPFRKLNYTGTYWSLWSFVPLALRNNYVTPTDPEFVNGLGHIALFALAATVVCIIAAMFVRHLWARRSRRVSRARVHALIMAGTILAVSLCLRLYGACTSLDSYLENNLSFLANYLTLAAVLFGSLGVRLRSKYVSSGTKLFNPLFVLNLLLIIFCVARCTTFLVRMFSPLFFALCGLWMCVSLLRRMDRLRISARVLAVLSILLMFVGAVLCYNGYYYLVILAELCWFVLVTNFMLMTAISKIGKLICRHLNAHRRFGKYRSYIAIWLQLAISQMVQPLIFLALIWYGLRWPAQGFNLGQFLDSWLSTPFHFNSFIRVVSGDTIILLLTVALALNCLLHIINSTANIISGATDAAKSSATWFTLSSMLAWGCYALFALEEVHADYNSMLVVMGGMSIGVGLGLKDNIENVISGISLMLGRLRPGDVVECDGLRGTVVNIGYRTTSFETVDGSVIVFQNSQLFTQNFRNLTRNHQYERCVVQIGVTYGTDVAFARRLILKELRHIPELTNQHPSTVLLDGFGDSSVDLSVVVWVPVSTKLSTLSRVREAIYRVFNENGIEIPFPQQDLYIKPLPGATVPPELHA